MYLTEKTSVSNETGGFENTSQASSRGTMLLFTADTSIFHEFHSAPQEKGAFLSPGLL